MGIARDDFRTITTRYPTCREIAVRVKGIKTPLPFRSGVWCNCGDLFFLKFIAPNIDRDHVRGGWGVNVPTTWQSSGVGEILENAVCMSTTGAHARREGYVTKRMWIISRELASNLLCTKLGFRRPHALYDHFSEITQISTGGGGDLGLLWQGVLQV